MEQLYLQEIQRLASVFEEVMDEDGSLGTLDHHTLVNIVACAAGNKDAEDAGREGYPESGPFAFGQPVNLRIWAVLRELVANEYITDLQVTSMFGKLLERADAAVMTWEPGGYPWDLWKDQALAAGVREDVAIAGRAVMREWDQHGWQSHGKEVGVQAGQKMISLALDSPNEAMKRWEWLVATDGGRRREG